MKYIKVKESGKTGITAKIILEKGKIIVEAKKDNTRLFLRGLIDKWKLDHDLKDAEVFKRLPDLVSYCSRLFFSNIINE